MCPVIRLGAGLQHFIVTAEDGHPMGGCVFNSATHEILGLYVSDSERGKGAAKQLIEAVEEYAKQQRLPRVFATCLPNNIPPNELFEALGYKQLTKWEKRFPEGSAVE